MTPQLWPVSEIAAWAGISLSSARKMIARQGFPKPFEPVGHSRWFSDEVIEWARRNRGTITVGRPRTGTNRKPKENIK